VTRRVFHPRESKLNGEVIYVGCGIDPEALVQAATNTIAQQNKASLTQNDDNDDDDSSGFHPSHRRTIIHNTGVAVSEWVEQVIREDNTGNLWRVAINHDENSHTASDGKVLKPYEVDVSRYRLP
jgi:hypothetical protein